VSDYYKKAGVDFNKHNWDEVAMEFISNYRKNVVGAKINYDATAILKYLSEKNIRQFILSAMEQEFLTETVGQRLDHNIFEEIVGLNNHYAHTKVENARLLVDKLGLSKNEMLIIGDTLHDYEVAESAGIRCVLYSGGHQSRKRLESSGSMIIDSLDEVRELF
jgi:phosphoglycolate phosphatase